MRKWIRILMQVFKIRRFEINEKKKVSFTNNKQGQPLEFLIIWLHLDERSSVMAIKFYVFVALVLELCR